MSRISLAEQIKKEHDALKKTQERINELKEKEARRLLRLADKVGYFEVDVTDEAIEEAFSSLVRSASKVS